MGKEAAQQRPQGRGQGGNRNQGGNQGAGNQGRGQPQQPQQPRGQQKPQAQQPQPEHKTRQQREESQKHAYEELIRKKEEEIRKHEHEKKSYNHPINKSFSLVRNHQNDLDKVPDLSQQWIEKNAYLPYLPQDNERDAEDVIQHHNFDISNLLKKDYKHFWSQILYDESLQVFLDSYLRYCARPYDTFPTHTTETSLDQKSVGTRPSNMTPLQQALFRRVFHTLVRASQYEETVSCHMEKTFFAQHVIKEKRIWTIPKILDFCALYGPHSREKVAEVVDRLFSLQPDLAVQLAESIPGIDKALEGAISRITNNEVPPSYDEVVDIGTYLLDTSETVRALLVVYPPAAHAFLSCPSFFQRLAQIYDHVLPIIENTILNPVPGMDEAFIEGIEIVRRNFLEIFHGCWRHAFFEFFAAKTQGRNTVCNTCKTRGIADVAGEVLAVFTKLPELSSAFEKASSEKGKGKGKEKSESSSSRQPGALVKALDKFFKLQSSLTKLKGSHPILDDASVIKLITAIREISGDNSQDTSSSQPTQQSPSQATSTSLPGKTDAPKKENASHPAPAQSDEHNAKLASLISQVKDLFPDLGDGFVEMSLQYYNFQPEQLLDALLEGNLPPQLASLDRKMARSAPKPTAAPTQSASTKQTAPIKLPESTADYSLSQRKNVFDGDEFDVMSRKVDTNRVIHGKKTMALDDSENQQIKSYITRYLRKEEDDYNRDVLRGNLYDDEYDDSYDEFTRMEVGTEGESLDSKSKSTGGAPRPQDIVEEGAGEESDEGEEKEGTNANGTGESSGSGRGRGRGGKGAGYHKYKSHHRKERSDKKRGFGPIS